MSETGLNVDLAQSMMISPQSIVVSNNNQGNIISGAGRSYNARRIAQPMAGGNPNAGSGGTFLTEVATNEHVDSRIVYPNVAETPHPALMNKGRAYHAPVQELGAQLSALHKKQLQILRKINDQRQAVHQPIVVHGYKDSQFNNGIRKMPPPPKKDAYYPLKKLNKRKQIEDLAAELSKKDNYTHDFSKHSVDDEAISVRSRRSTKSRSLPPISSRSQDSDAISHAFSDLNPVKERDDDRLSQYSSASKNTRKSRKSELSFSIGSDAESDRIRQLEESLKDEEDSRKSFLKVLDDIQKKQEYLLSKLSPEDRQQFESLYGSSSMVASLMPRDTDTLSQLSVKDIETLSSREHLPKLDSQSVSQKGPKSVYSTAPSQHSQVSQHSYHSQQSQQSNVSKSASQYSYQSGNSNISGKTTGSQISSVKKMIKEMFHTIVSTESIVTLDQSTQLARLLDKYPDVLNEEDKQKFYAKHNDPRFNGASYRSLNTKDHFGRVVFY